MRTDCLEPGTVMSTSLNLLLLEDSPADAELMIEVLRESGFDPTFRRVESKDAYRRELEQPPDFILSDYSMPQFTARDALRLMKERGWTSRSLLSPAASARKWLWNA